MELPGIHLEDTVQPSSEIRNVHSVTCQHCGLPLTGFASDRFCCSGCAVAFEAIRLAGLSDTYYSLRHLSPSALGVAVTQTAASALSKHQIASDRFITESTHENKDGSREVCLAIDGLTCAACGWLAEQVVLSQDGMWGASVNLPGATLTFEFDQSRASLPKLIDTLARFGYELHPRKERPDGPTPQERKLLTKVGISWALAGNIMLLAFALYAGLNLESDPTYATAARWASLIIASASVAYGGTEFFRTAIASVRIAVQRRSLRRLHIDTPISLGILVGYSHSAWATLSGKGDVWFDSIAVLIAALLTARWLQMRSQRTASQAASRLLDMVPSTSRRILSNGSEDFVASEDVRPGDTIRVDPGEIIPVDGVVTSGSSNINKSVLTGESAPVRVSAGDAIYAGSVNQSSPLLVLSETSGTYTRVGQLLQWLEDSRGAQAPVVQLADRISGYFVIGILVAAVATAVAGSFLFPGTVSYRVVALLVISCPCALGMSTPLAIAAANGKAARRGIYIKDGAAVEALDNVSTVVFDKTGTLTEGKLSVISFEGTAVSLRVASALEKHSRHPIGEAIRLFYKTNHPSHYGPAINTLGHDDIEMSNIEMSEIDGFDVANVNAPDLNAPDLNATEVNAIAGSGISGLVDGLQVSVGRPEWIRSTSVFPSRFSQLEDEIAGKGYSPVAISIDGIVTAVLGCGDNIRPESSIEISKLKERGINVVLLSGDDSRVAKAVAKLVGIDRDKTFGDIGPEDKKAFIENLGQSETVMMIGDGANDAAALRAAHVGVSVGNDNAPCVVASDIFVPASAGSSATMLLDFGHNVLRLIKRNLRVSLAYNIVAGGAAMLGLVTPLVAAVAMPLSSLFVVTTSMAVRPFASNNINDSNDSNQRPKEVTK